MDDKSNNRGGLTSSGLRPDIGNVSKKIMSRRNSAAFRRGSTGIYNAEALKEKHAMYKEAREKRKLLIDPCAKY